MILLSWALIRRNKELVGVALVVAVVSAFLVLTRLAYGILTWSYDEFYRLSDLALVFFAAGFPFLSIAFFYFLAAKVPSQPPATVLKNQD
ncbi:MAG: hypothetical protein ABIZ49_14570 [Opitutaceae bacterium]